MQFNLLADTKTTRKNNAPQVKTNIPYRPSNDILSPNYIPIRIGKPTIFMTRSEYELLQTREYRGYVGNDYEVWTITCQQQEYFKSQIRLLAEFDYNTHMHMPGYTTHLHPMQPLIVHFGEKIIVEVYPTDMDVNKYNANLEYENQIIELDVDNTDMKRLLMPTNKL